MEQLLGVQTIEAVAVASAHQHEVIEFAGDDMTLHASRYLRRRFLKVGERVRGRPIEHDPNHHQHSGIEYLRIQQRDYPCYHAYLFESLDTSKARRRTQVDFGRQRHVREGSVALQDAQDCLVGAIEHLRRRSGIRDAFANFCCVHTCIEAINSYRLWNVRSKDAPIALMLQPCMAPSSVRFIKSSAQWKRVRACLACGPAWTA